MTGHPPPTNPTASYMSSPPQPRTLSDAVRMDPGWWKRQSVRDLLSGYFKSHVVMLMVEFDHEGKIEQDLHTGFLLHHHDTPMWITAGHVIDRILLFQTRLRSVVRRIRWIDGHEVLAASAIPDSLDDLSTFSWNDADDFDAGGVVLRGLVLDAFRHNPELRWFTERAWTGRDTITPTGFYVVGCPRERWKVEETPLEHAQVQRKLIAEIVCLPVSRVEWQEDPHDRFWDDPSAMYAKIHDPTEPEGRIVRRIHGMSGGPLLSLYVNHDNGIVYHLWGIQRSAQNETRFVRCEPIEEFVERLPNHTT